MSNSDVPAAAEGVPRFNRSEIMKDAWARYRDIRVQYSAKQIELGFVDGSFSACLVIAWRVAKKQAAAKARQARIDAMLTSTNGERLRGLLGALQNSNFLSFRFDQAAERARIEQAISDLIGEAA